jgi:hypothetical protein
VTYRAVSDLSVPHLYPAALHVPDDATPCATAPCAAANGSGCRKECDIRWLIPWKCADLEMKPVEPSPRFCGLHGLLWCPPEEKKENGNGNGNGKNGAKKNGDGDKKDPGAEKKNDNGKNGDKKNGNGEEEKEPPTPLMGLIQCFNPALYNRMECRGTKVFGWLQGGYTVNFDSPRDRLNFGTNFNNRSNDFTWNQMPYMVIEKALDLDKKKDKWHMGYRVDFAAGHDVPYWENIGLGWFDRFTGDRLEASRLTEYGIGIPQFYVDIHTPILTERGVDFRFGRMFTHQTFELSPAPSTYFYSHSYEYFYGMPFTHLGAMATVHVGDTIDIMNGIARGWDVVWQDTNDTNDWIGSVVWNSCDKHKSFAFTWAYGPQQIGNNHDDRSTLTAYYTRKFGCRDQWMWVGGGGLGWEQNANPLPAAISSQRTAEWYALSTYLFYTVNPKLTLGTRLEWFRDDDGARTAFANSDNGGARWNRPGYAGNFYDLTLGLTYRPFKNLRVRPELRFDWFDGPPAAGNPFNDQTDRFQTTLGMDLIWEF